MGTVQSGLSLLLTLTVVGVLIFLSRRDTRPRRGHGPGGHAGPGAGPGGRASSGFTTLASAFSVTLFAAILLVSGLIGYRVGRTQRYGADRWSEDYLWQQIWMGLALACAAAWFWRKGLRELRSNVYVPELAGRETSPSAPPSRRIERR